MKFKWKMEINVLKSKHVNINITDIGIHAGTTKLEANINLMNRMVLLI